MEIMGTQIYKILIITLISISGKFIESSKKFRFRSANPDDKVIHIKAVYECINFHLTTSLGMLGLFWATNADGTILLVMIMVMIFGLMSKSAISNHNPQRLSIKDPDIFWGVFVPNACGIASIIILIIETGFNWK